MKNQGFMVMDHTDAEFVEICERWESTEAMRSMTKTNPKGGSQPTNGGKPDGLANKRKRMAGSR